MAVEKFEMSRLLGVDCDRKGRSKCGCRFSKPSLTEQWHKESCDVNNVVKQYTMAGYRSQDFRDLAARVFADARNFSDNTWYNKNDAPKTLEQAQEMVEQAKRAFVQDIPSAVRERFNNNALEFYRYASDMKNHDQLRALFSDARNFNAPSAEQLEEGVHSRVPSPTNGDSKE